MKLQAYLLVEEITTKSVGNLDADAVTSNKIRLKMKDNMIKKMINYLKQRTGTKVLMKGDIAEVSFEHAISPEVKKQLKQYMV